MKRFSLLLLAAFSLTAGQVIDRVAAVVNEDIILVSEVEEKLFILDAQGQIKDRDTTEVAKLRKEILDRLIEEKLIVQRAKSQGIGADASDLQKRVDEAMEKVRAQFPSLEAFREALRQEGISESMLRERYQSDIEQELLGQKIVGKEVRTQVDVKSDDVEKYFRENKDELPRKPMELQLAHILTRPVDAATERAAQERIEKARARIQGGEPFEDVARDASDDPTRTRGGVLGWFEKGDLDPAFEAAVESLDVGRLSPSVRSAFGYHLIEVLERDGDRFRVRHILALVEPKPDQIEAARARAEAARARVQGGESFETVAREMSEDEFTREQGGDLGWISPKLLVAEVGGSLDSLEVGEVSAVLSTQQGFNVFKIMNRKSGEEFTYEEIKDRLRTFLEQKKLEEAYDKWMTGIRDSSYVEIKTWSR